ncbi:mechanosensitive ion channel family protein [Jiella endophytica]|uniref:Mechanosensitive ion channel family protein n=1 Tax=Jiella endophytica TaxID=2558362 RepID=A0A4Y8RNG3_9HYPH|nr:mechanosensitive ion channel family protein [Jiella endophytica]TFF24851.1 mechanosensitive ion channel family protein [Jiella endophytica]
MSTATRDRRSATSRLTALAALLILSSPLLVSAAFAQEASVAPAAQEAPSPSAATAGGTRDLPLEEKLRQVKGMIDDPEVSAWLDAQGRPAAVLVPAVPKTSYIEARIERIRSHLKTVLAAGPDLAGTLAGLFGSPGRGLTLQGSGYGLLLVALTLALGAAGSWLMHRAVSGRGSHTEGPPEGAALMLPPLGFAFAGAIVLFLFDWPPTLRRVVVAFLLAYVGTRLVVVGGRVLLALLREEGRDKPETPPEDLARHRYWQARTSLFLGYLFFGWAAVETVDALGAPVPARQLAAYILGLGLLLIAAASVWQRPTAPVSADRARLHTVAILVALILLWLLWVAGLMTLLWVGIFALVLPAAVRLAGTVARVAASRRVAETPKARLLPVIAERVGRAAVILVAIAWLASFAGADAASLTGGADFVSRLLRGILGGIAVLLIADLVWAILRATIDDRLRQARSDVADTEEAQARRARLLTLLPIIRNLLAVAIAIVALLMVLAGLGVEIAPLIAGAGVVGVAVGFGAQTVVKDVISGMFYLWDDAFRVGEYIQSGGYKGTVESFSLRSVKLRHHRGPLFTVPFGELGAVQNMSRDWVIDVMSVNVPYDTDLQKVKAIVKDIGRQLQEAPEFKPHIIQTLKMKGVQQFGDFAMNLRLAMTTRPGQQFTIRRQAYAMIRKAFPENGIEIAIPTVQIASDGDPQTNQQAAAAAQRMQVAGNPGAA